MSQLVLCAEICCLFIISPLSIREWVDSLEPESDDVDDSRNTPDYDFTHPYKALMAPLLTNSNNHLEGNMRGRTRAGNPLGDNDLSSPLLSNLAPCTPFSRELSPSRGWSPWKHQRLTSPMKVRTTLLRLQKPVYFSSLGWGLGPRARPAYRRTRLVQN